jgi:hypothetical protein
MKRLVQLVAVITCVGVGTVLLAPAAEAKLLPYQLRVDSPRVVNVNQAVAVVMQLDPQNVFGPAIEWEVRWARLARRERPMKAARAGAGSGLVMLQTGPKEYRSAFTPLEPGRYMVYGSTAVQVRPRRGYPKPIVIRAR